MKKEVRVSKIKKETIWLIIISCIFIVTTFPLLWMTKYAHMSADDFGYGLHAFRNFVETGSVIEAMKGACKTVLMYYDCWQGTYSSLFLFAMQPGIFGEQFYFLGPLFIILLFIVASVFMVFTIFQKIFLNNNKVSFICSIFITMILLQFIHSPAQAFYFYNAGVHYIFMESIFFFSIILGIRMLEQRSTKCYILLSVFHCICAVMIGGGNYITAFAFLLLGLGYLILTIRNYKKSFYAFLPGYLMGAVGFIVSAVAPGNRIRGEEGGELSPVQAIIMSFRYSLQGLQDWITVLIVLSLLFLVPFLWKQIRYNFKGYRYPLLVVIASFLFYTAMFTPTCYAMGFSGAGRCNNIYQITLYLLLFFNLTYCLGWLKFSLGIGLEENKYKNQGCIIAYLLGILLLIGSISVAGDWNEITSLSAVSSVYHKEAQLYHVNMMAREEILKNSTEKKISLDEIPVKPYLLYYADITVDPTDWKNVAMSKWYRKKEIMIK